MEKEYQFLISGKIARHSPPCLRTLYPASAEIHTKIQVEKGQATTAMTAPPPLGLPIRAGHYLKKKGLLSCCKDHVPDISTRAAAISAHQGRSHLSKRGGAQFHIKPISSPSFSYQKIYKISRRR